MAALLRERNQYAAYIKKWFAFGAVSAGSGSAHTCFSVRSHARGGAGTKYLVLLWLIVAGLVAISTFGPLGGGESGGTDAIPYSHFLQYLDANAALFVG